MEVTRVARRSILPDGRSLAWYHSEISHEGPRGETAFMLGGGDLGCHEVGTLRAHTVTAPFTIETVRRGCSLILIVEGELDLVTSPLLDEQLTRARATEATTIVVDLLGISFMDSSGLHVLIKHACSNDQPNRVRLTTGPPQIQRLFEIAGLLDRLPFCSNA